MGVWKRAARAAKAMCSDRGDFLHSVTQQVEQVFVYGDKNIEYPQVIIFPAQNTKPLVRKSEDLRKRA
jgi:hypothetical protein